MSDDVANCGLCSWSGPVEEVLAHLRVEHDVDAVPAEWPDGGVVIVDNALEPDDFDA